MGDAFEHGVIIGRFNPPHRGHAFLIDVAMRCSRSVTLFLCSLPAERIPGELRIDWLQKMFPALTVVHITTADGEAAQGNPQAVEIWTCAIRNHLTRSVDVLFASEHYGAELADRLGASFFPVDTKRALVSVSGEVVRKDPFRYWQYIPEVAKGYFVLPIIIDAPILSQELDYAKVIADHLQGALFSPPAIVSDTPELAQCYLMAQMAASHHSITLCSKQFSDVAALLPQTYYAPLCIHIRRTRYSRFRITMAAAEGRQERVWSTYRVLKLLKRISYHCLQKSII